MTRATTIDRMTVQQTFGILKMLEANGKKVGEYWEFNDGWSDERIAREFKVPATAVAYRRKEAFGQLRRGSRFDGNPELAAKLETLETSAQATRVAIYKLEKRCEALEKTLNALMTAPNREVLMDKIKDLQAMYAKANGQ